MRQRRNAFAKELELKAQAVQRAGWFYDDALKVWRHASHPRHYVSVCKLYDEYVTEGKPA